MKHDLVSFKGIKEGIYIYIKKGDFQLIKKEIEYKLENSVNFFKDADILGIDGEHLAKDEIDQLLQIIKGKYNLNIPKDGLLPCLDKTDCYTYIDQGMAKFINGTIRSGQVVEYDCNIIIIGDVNPGALIKAKGNIIVLGVLRGIAHAGIDGNKEAIVAAHSLQPTQLRIADVISRRPDGKMVNSKLPEIAKIYDGEIFIEPYLTRR